MSPDGKWIAAHNDEGLVVIPTGTGEQKQITRGNTEAEAVAWDAYGYGNRFLTLYVVEGLK